MKATASSKLEDPDGSWSRRLIALCWNISASSATMSKVGKSVKVKEENEIQSYINSFKEIEEPDDEPSTSGGSKKVFLSTDQLETEDYEQLIVRDDQVNDDEYKYVFIVQDDEDGGEDKGTDVDGEIYEFDELEEEGIEEVDEKSKIVKIISSTSPKKIGSAASGQGNTHMCSYCNYTTPKRYLLARHMKCHSEDRWVQMARV